jgi:hypothetical protein
MTLQSEAPSGLLTQVQMSALQMTKHGFLTSRKLRTPSGPQTTAACILEELELYFSS